MCPMISQVIIGPRAFHWRATREIVRCFVSRTLANEQKSISSTANITEQQRRIYRFVEACMVQMCIRGGPCLIKNFSRQSKKGCHLVCGCPLQTLQSRLPVVKFFLPNLLPTRYFQASLLTYHLCGCPLDARSNCPLPPSP